jgi:AcrR family transcriptional regulator
MPRDQPQSNRKVEQGRVTRERLIATATRLFAEHGYDRTSIEAVLQDADVSRGALYHHFGNKEALFEAVLEGVETKIQEVIVAAAITSSDPVQALRTACRTWVRLAGDPTIQRIAIIDAPAVVGWQKWREIDGRHNFGMIRGTLEAIAATGRISKDSVDLLAHLLLAALLEAALVIAHSDGPGGDRQEAVLDEFITRLVGAESPRERRRD